MSIHLPLVHQVAVLAFGVLLLWAALSDLREYLIPNRLVVALVALYPSFVLASPAPVEWIGAVAGALAALAVGLGLFAARVMGGGDVKLIAAVCLWAGPGLILPFLFIAAIVGGILSFTIFSLLRLSLMPAQETAAAPTRAPRQRVPYGVAIASGGLFVASRLMAA